jgi:hypothetical protein
MAITLSPRVKIVFLFALFIAIVWRYRCRRKPEQPPPPAETEKPLVVPDLLAGDELPIVPQQEAEPSAAPKERPPDEIQNDINNLIKLVGLLRQLQPRLTDTSVMLDAEMLQTDEVATQQQVNINDLAPDDADLQYKILFSFAEIIRRRLAATERGLIALDKAEAQITR